MRLMLSTAIASLLALPAAAETLVDTIIETRTNLFFTVPEEEAQALLPAGWSLAPLPGGPAAGANMLVVLIDRISALGPDKQPLGAAENRVAVLVVFGQDEAAGAGGPVVVGGWSEQADGAPGPYGVFVDGEVDLERRVVAADKAEVEESWAVSGESGDRLEVGLTYSRSGAAFAAFDQKVYSGSDPGFHRIYRGDQGVIVVASGPLGIGSPEKIAVTAEGDTLGTLIDDDAELVAVMNLPWYRRDTLLP